MWCTPQTFEVFFSLSGCRTCEVILAKQLYRGEAPAYGRRRAPRWPSAQYCGLRLKDLLFHPLRHRVPHHGAAQLPALVARPRVPPAAPPAPDDRRRVDQVLVVLVAEPVLPLVLPNLPFFFLRGQFFLSGRAHSPGASVQVTAGNSFLHGFPISYSPRSYVHVSGRIACFVRFCATKMLLVSSVCLYTDETNSSFCTIFAWFLHDMILHGLIVLGMYHPNPEVFYPVRGDGAGGVSKQACRKARSAEQAQCWAGVRRTDVFFVRPVHRSSLAISVFLARGNVRLDGPAPLQNM